MRSSTIGFAVLAVALGAGMAPDVQAQQARQPDGTPATTLAPAGAPPAARPDSSTGTDRRTDGARSEIVEASALEAGANSFTEGQARSRFEDAGFTAIQNLRKDDQGFWRARGMQGGSAATDLALDFRGRIASGPGVASLPAGSAGAASSGPAVRDSTATPGTLTDRRPDGAPGNPPSTATGRAVDRLQGETPRPDGTPGNPAGTAAGRAVDRTTGSNTTGANPSGVPTRDGTTSPTR
jgi:putative membrane protein